MRCTRPTILAAVRRRDLQVLGADADRIGPGRHRDLGNERRRKEIDLRRTEPLGDVAIAWIFVDLARCAELEELAVPDDADPRGHRHGLDLIVGHVQDRRAELDLNPLQLQTQLGAQLGVERRQRLVHQIDGRIAHQGPPDGDPLHFAAGQARRPVAELAGDVQQLRRLLDAFANGRLRGRGGPASAAGTRDCRRRSGADKANIAERRTRYRAYPADRCVTSRPLIEIEPPSGRSRPAISRSVVVLPAPLGPSSTTNSPLLMAKDRSRTASMRPKRLLTWRRATLAMADAPMACGPDCRTGLRIEQRQTIGPERQAHASRRPCTGMLEGSRALTRPCSVSTVTICVVPRYSAPKTRPRTGAASENRMCSGRTPSTSGPTARCFANLGYGNAGVAELDRPGLPACRPASKCRKFIGGEPMKSATNMLAGRS